MEIDESAYKAAREKYWSLTGHNNSPSLRDAIEAYLEYANKHSDAVKASDHFGTDLYGTTDHATQKSEIKLKHVLPSELPKEESGFMMNANGEIIGYKRVEIMTIQEYMKRYG